MSSLCISSSRPVGNSLSYSDALHKRPSIDHLLGDHPDFGLRIEKVESGEICVYFDKEKETVLLPKFLDTAFQKHLEVPRQDCSTFVSYAMGLDQKTEHELNDYRVNINLLVKSHCSLKKCDSQKIPDGSCFQIAGDTFFGESGPIHFGIYIKNGLTLSKIGLDGPVIFCPIEELTKFYRSDIIYLFSLKE